jgi:hypothetical protein
MTFEEFIMYSAGLSLLLFALAVACVFVWAIGASVATLAGHAWHGFTARLTRKRMTRPESTNHEEK